MSESAQSAQNDTGADSARLYDEYVPRRIDPDAAADVLRKQAYLGIEGRSANANARRADRAETILAEAAAREDQAYSNASWTDEPRMPDVKLVRLVAEAGGDVQAIPSDELRDVVMSALDAHGTESVVSDEDGTHFEWLEPMDDPDVAEAVDSTLAQLRDTLLRNDAAQPETAAAAANLSDRGETMTASLDDEAARVRQVSAYGYPRSTREMLASAATRPATQATPHAETPAAHTTRTRTQTT
ncbi:hypothetical protein CU254_42710 (plasmid) [Amycolatopsis sp. AA4]|uniref:hypothetical protein n=1 Tax=Actinomycetes TaxID=1760 RepID=UPI0001B57694|nr:MULTISPECIES: hypothetical protein [Actinomycetes]ATY17298.1 hypothetical protein CU254_42710 [Amycolatopsis sp. AA4]